MTNLGFLHANVHISNSDVHANFIFGTNIQQHKIDIMIKVQVTLTKAEGHKLSGDWDFNSTIFKFSFYFIHGF